ncbi:DUF2628 domain-containing protein [Clostridium sp. HBUAS56010]|uniref:DUF2628 domain-containing protein n=1 Tax=Clostridium sp. HBUAS56010 TaxID=2571127 RepID=UPI0011776778|nr:DUF2628 domain-containing protein [Clostridium sp. HBUAS56010]
MENQQTDPNTWAIQTFVGPNYEYYKYQWANRTPDRSFTTFNWVAFFFPFYWLVYRKMYFYAFVFSLIYFFSVILSIFIPFVMLFLNIFSGIYANYIYLKRCHNVLIRASGMPKEKAEVFFKRHGHTSSAALIISIVATVLLISMFFLAIIIGLNLDETSGSVTLEQSQSEQEIQVESTSVFQTYDGVITSEVSSDFQVSDYNNTYHDLELSANDDSALITLDLYPMEDLNESLTEKDIIDLVVTNFNNTYFTTPIVDRELPPLDSQVFQALYSYNSDDYIYYLHLCCKKVDNYYVLSTLFVSPSQWDSYKTDNADIISNARLTVNDL